MGEGKRYSAGAIFLQVVPVFQDVQKAIESEAKGWERALGDDMEKAGEKAGQRAGKAAGREINASMEEELRKGAADMEKALGSVNTKNLGKKLRSEVQAMRADLESISKVDLKVDDNFDKVAAKVAGLRAEIEGMRKRSTVFFDIKGLVQVYRQITQLEATLAAIQNVDVKVDLDTRGVDRKIGTFERTIKRAMKNAKSSIGESSAELSKLRDELDYLSRLRVGVDIGANQLRREVAEITADLKRLSREDPNIDVKIDAGRAFAELAGLEAVLKKVDEQKVKPKIDVSGARRSADDAANSFRSFNIILYAVAALGPALVPALGAIAGGLLAIAPAAAVAAAGVASVVIGFSGLGGALQALQARQDQQAKNAQTAGKQNRQAARTIADAQRSVADAERNAARAAADAARRVADARRSAAEGIRSALEQQRQAQETYANSVRDVQQAEDDLRKARADAKGTGHKLGDQIKDNNNAITQAQLDSASATNNYNAVMADGSSTNTEKIQAKLQREEALQALHELRDQQKELAKEKKKWDKTGVEGTDAVKSAEDKLHSALQRERDDYRALQKAARDVDKARADGARQVADALQAQSRTLADNKRALEDARRNVVRARDSQDALNESITSQDAAVQAAFSKLGPAGRRFALFLFGLKSGFYSFRDEIQAAMLPSIQDAIESLIGSKSGSVVRNLLIGMADGFGRFTKALSASFQGPAWLHFFQTLSKLGPSIQSAYGTAFIKFMEALASILNVLSPYALMFANGLAKMMTSFAGWAASKSGADGIRSFMDWAVSVAPDVLRFLGALAGAFSAIAKALAPWGDVVLHNLTGFLDFLSSLNPQLLAGLVTSLTVVLTASQTAYALQNLAKAGRAVLMSTLGIWVFAIIGIAAALVYLYKTNEKFRKFVNKAWKEIGAVVSSMWKKYLKPALTELMGALTQLWHQVLVPLFKVLGPILVFTIKVLLVELILYLTYSAKVLTFVIKYVIIPLFKLIGTVLSFVWKAILKPVITALVAAWKGLSAAIHWAWTKLIKPVFSAFGLIATVLWKATLKVIFLLIRQGFRAMAEGMRLVWQKILSPLFSIIKKAALWLWEKSGLKYVFGLISDGWRVMVAGIKHVWTTVLKPIWDHISDKALPKLQNAFQVTIDAIKGIWDGLKKIVAAPIKFLLETVINNGLIDGFNAVAKWVGQKGFKHIPIPKAIDKAYATGGVLPGYTPGRDVHDFYSATAGRLHLSGGEAIMRPEWTAAMGSGYVNQMNAIAARKGVSGVRQAMGGQAYARGGVFNPDDKVYINGMAISRMAAAQVAIAKQKSGIPIYMMQGGFGGNHVAASGSSHNYPGVGDFGPGSIALEKIMRQVGFAAWARNIPGRSQVGSGAHVHAVSLLDPGDAFSPQVYGSWAHNGNGLSGYNNDPAPHYAMLPGLMAKIQSMGFSEIASLFGGKGGKSHRSIPGFIKDIVLHPIKTVKGFIGDQFGKAKGVLGDLGNTAFMKLVKHVPEKLVGGIAGKAYDLLPGWVKSTLGAAAHIGHDVKEGATNVVKGAGHVAGAVADGLGIGMADGGILPYNGTMKYDNGGYLAPGMTTVMNLTGKPEPVFTNDQWSSMRGGSSDSGNIHYEPHFEGSDLTPEDVAADLNFTLRRIRRGGRYVGVGTP